MLQRFTKNEHGRDLIVGDIHGHASKLLAELEAVGYDPERDRVFLVGDLVDRGPESAEALALLDRPGWHAVQGNHEEMLVGWLTMQIETAFYRANGGAWVMELPAGEARKLALRAVGLPIAIELETDAGLLGLVHACCPTIDWGDFAEGLRNPDSLEPEERQRRLDMALWSRARIDHVDSSEVAGVRAVIVGHTPVERLTSLGNTYFVDGGGWLGSPARRPFIIIDAATLAPAYAPAPEGSPA